MGTGLFRQVDIEMIVWEHLYWKIPSNNGIKIGDVLMASFKRDDLFFPMTSVKLLIQGYAYISIRKIWESTTVSHTMVARSYKVHVLVFLYKYNMGHLTL